MGDIVERLRSPANVFYEYAADNGAFLREAADEIERLREENTYLQQIIKEYQRAMGFDEECSIALGEKE